MLESMRTARAWSKAIGNLNLVKYHVSFGKLLKEVWDSGTKIGIITRSPGHYAKAALAAHNIPYHHLIAYHDVAKRKPDPEAFIKMLALLKVEAKDCISIGDADIDIKASHAAGIKCIGARWYTANYVFTTKPEIIIDDLEDLINHLN